MGPKLKEDPREWFKFMAGVCLAALIAGLLLLRAGRVGKEAIWWLAAVVTLSLLVAVLKPASIRPIYRVGMTLGFYVGHVVTRVLLTFMFLLFLTPFGILLRLFGKDLLALKRRSD